MFFDFENYIDFPDIGILKTSFFRQGQKHRLSVIRGLLQK